MGAVIVPDKTIVKYRVDRYFATVVFMWHPVGL